MTRLDRDALKPLWICAGTSVHALHNVLSVSHRAIERNSLIFDSLDDSPVGVARAARVDARVYERLASCKESANDVLGLDTLGKGALEESAVACSGGILLQKKRLALSNGAIHSYPIDDHLAYARKDALQVHDFPLGARHDHGKKAVFLGALRLHQVVKHDRVGHVNDLLSRNAKRILPPRVLFRRLITVRQGLGRRQGIDARENLFNGMLRSLAQHTVVDAQGETAQVKVIFQEPLRIRQELGHCSPR